jgi:hypothetical protein
MSLQVVGAGFGRTGTLSLKAALERLGFEKCHHMQEVFASRTQLEAWHALSHGGKPDWDAIFDGYASSCDWPSCSYWEELYERYPNSKVILTVRDEDRWYQSVKETIYPISTGIPWWIRALSSRARMATEMVLAVIWQGTFKGNFENKEEAIRIFRENSEYVRRTAAPDRLLVFEAKDGWAPLCKFLEVPIPDEPYPHLNEAGPMKRIRRILIFLRWLPAIVLAIAVAGLWPTLVGN